ncbi:MAG: hypothetical protein WC942_12285, partial [Clostridia bacterium]
DENDNIIPSNNYTVFYREGLVVFNYPVDNDYITGDYKISILNTSKYKVGLKLINSSKDSDLEIYGIGLMYSTGSDFLPPIEKIPPQVSNVIITNIIPGIYDKIDMSYTYFDSNYDEEDISSREIKWYINNVHIPYLDNLKEWNDISDINDPLFKYSLSFSISDLVNGQTVPEKARENGESILKVGDSIFCTIKVSDGNLSSETGKSNIVRIVESKPYISGLKLNSIGSDGKILERLSSNNTVFVSFKFISDLIDNKSEIVWFVNGAEFKRGIVGGENADRILPGEVSPNSLDLGLLMGNDIYVRVTPKTNSSVGDPIVSDLYVIKNSYPVISNSKIIPTVPNESQDMILSWEFFDFEINALKDPNQINSSIIKWYRKNPGGTSFSEITDSTNIITVIENSISTVKTAILSYGQQWYATLTPNDGIDSGTIVTTKTVTIGKRI